MAKLISRRRVALDSPEDMLTLTQRLWEPVKPLARGVGVGGAGVAVALCVWGINAWIQGSRDAKAAAALTLVTPQADLNAPSAAAAAALEKFVKEYPGTPAARDALLMRANLLYGLKKYDEAAKAYEALLKVGDPGWDTLVNESLSYCYEGMGKFKEAAAVLKPVVDQTYGPLKSETTQRLAMLYDKAKEPQEAAIYWRKLAEQPSDTALAPYFQEKLAAAEAKIKK